MDKRKVKKDGRVFALKDIKIIKGIYRDPDYRLELYHNNRATETMHLIIGKLIPKNKSLPYFVFRWDENQDQCDVDIGNVNVEIKKKFKARKSGYSGHHPRRFIDKGRCLDVDINLPNKKIFQGFIKVPVIREEILDM